MFWPQCCSVVSSPEGSNSRVRAVRSEGPERPPERRHSAPFAGGASSSGPSSPFASQAPSWPPSAPASPVQGKGPWSRPGSRQYHKEGSTDLFKREGSTDQAEVAAAEQAFALDALAQKAEQQAAQAAFEKSSSSSSGASKIRKVSKSTNASQRAPVQTEPDGAAGVFDDVVRKMRPPSAEDGEGGPGRHPSGAGSPARRGKKGSADAAMGEPSEAQRVHAATTIQRISRGFFVRMASKRTQPLPSAARGAPLGAGVASVIARTGAAVTIQRHVSGFLVRRQVRRLVRKERKRLREIVREACDAMGRPSEQDHWVQRLEAEYITSPLQLQNLKRDQWARLKLPLGLETELRNRLDILADGAGPGDSGPNGRGRGGSGAATQYRGNMGGFMRLVGESSDTGSASETEGAASKRAPRSFLPFRR